MTNLELNRRTAIYSTVSTDNRYENMRWKIDVLQGLLLLNVFDNEIIGYLIMLTGIALGFVSTDNVYFIVVLISLGSLLVSSLLLSMFIANTLNPIVATNKLNYICNRYYSLMTTKDYTLFYSNGYNTMPYRFVHNHFMKYNRDKKELDKILSGCYLI